MQWLVGGSGGYGCDGGLRGFVQAWCMTSSHVRVERMDGIACAFVTQFLCRALSVAAFSPLSY